MSIRFTKRDPYDDVLCETSSVFTGLTRQQLSHLDLNKLTAYDFTKRERDSFVRTNCCALKRFPPIFAKYYDLVAGRFVVRSRELRTIVPKIAATDYPSWGKKQELIQSLDTPIVFGLIRSYRRSPGI